MEDGNAFDLQKEIKGLLQESEKKIRINEKAVRIGIIFEIVIMIGILAAVTALAVL